MSCVENTHQMPGVWPGLERPLPGEVLTLQFKLIIMSKWKKCDWEYIKNIVLFLSLMKGRSDSRTWRRVTALRVSSGIVHGHHAAAFLLHWQFTCKRMRVRRDRLTRTTCIATAQYCDKQKPRSGTFSGKRLKTALDASSWNIWTYKGPNLYRLNGTSGSH